MKETRTIQMPFRVTPKDAARIRKACAPLGITPSVYVRTIVLRELATAFPDSADANSRMIEAVAEMAGQVVRELSRGAAPKKVKRA